MYLCLFISLSTPTDPQYKYYANLLQVTPLHPFSSSLRCQLTPGELLKKKTSSSNSQNIPAHNTVSATVNT